MTLAPTRVIFAMALATSLGGVAGAENLRPMQAGTFTLNDWTASVYYIDNGGSYEVVVTMVALHGEERVPIRLTTELDPGESKTVEVGSFDTSEDLAVLEIERAMKGYRRPSCPTPRLSPCPRTNNSPTVLRHRSFDTVVSQFGLMFFDDAPRAFVEMRRVLVPGGRLAVAVFDAIETAPGYDALARLLDSLFGREVGDAMRAPFVLGDADRLRALAATAFSEATVRRHDGWVSFPSIADLVATEHSCIWTLGGLIDDEQAARLRCEAERDLRPFVRPDGSVAFAMPALTVTAGRPH
jgi:SAM-dependent methyltransferase